MPDLTTDDIKAMLRNTVFALRSETKSTNPIAFMHGNVSFIELLDKRDTKGFGDWMFNNGYNAALVQAEIYVQTVLDKVRRGERDD